MNRRFAIGLVSLAVLAIGGFLGFRHLMREPTSDDLEIVQMDMTRAEVISILGEPTEIESSPERTWLQWNTQWKCRGYISGKPSDWPGLASG